VVGSFEVQAHRDELGLLQHLIENIGGFGNVEVAPGTGFPP
jgi:hypothetical protein